MATEEYLWCSGFQIEALKIVIPAVNFPFAKAESKLLLLLEIRILSNVMCLKQLKQSLCSPQTLGEHSRFAEP